MIMTTVLCMFVPFTIFLIMAVAVKYRNHGSCVAYDPKVQEGYLWAKESGSSLIELFELVHKSRDFGDYDEFDMGVEKYMAELQRKEIG